MNNLRNKVSLIGRLGMQPEFTTTSNGKTLARFSLAINSSYKDKEGNWKEETQWININAWGNVAELVKYQIEKATNLSVGHVNVHVRGLRISNTD